MYKFILLKQKSTTEKGFVTLEILISLLIALAFVAISMQSLVYAMAMKVQAQEKQRANQLIQEDIERVKQLGSNTDLAGSCTSANYTGGYANNLWTSLQTEAAGTNTTTSVTKTLLKKINTSGAAETGGKTLGLRRFHVSNNPATAPYRTLKIRYEIWHWDGSDFVDKNGDTTLTSDTPIAETYVEVIPNVALACP
jgi:type II secretory pathway pseudopilin PulG